MAQRMETLTQIIVDGVWVEYKLTGKTEYSLWSIDCQHYAKEVASGIVTREA